MQRQKLKYFVTPQGLAIKARLTSQYMEASLRTFCGLRQAAWVALAEVNESGYHAMHLEGDGEAMEIFRLTCLEQRITTVTNSERHTPARGLEGTNFAVRWPEPPARITESKEDGSR